uniref:hypothetical protein n=1 Tax=Roseivirga sp. TaxID=1964215 RepID=UPI0040487E72
SFYELIKSFAELYLVLVFRFGKVSFLLAKVARPIPVATIAAVNNNVFVFISTSVWGYSSL